MPDLDQDRSSCWDPGVPSTRRFRIRPLKRGWADDGRVPVTAGVRSRGPLIRAGTIPSHLSEPRNQGGSRTTSRRIVRLRAVVGWRP